MAGDMATNNLIVAPFASISANNNTKKIKKAPGKPGAL
jgi:hypothetical protein